MFRFKLKRYSFRKFFGKKKYVKIFEIQNADFIQKLNFQTAKRVSFMQYIN